MIISVVGPTSVGKTAFALWLSEQLLTDGRVAAVDLISADSRQVYKGLEVTTGADVPPEFLLHSIEVETLIEDSILPPKLIFFQKGNVRWHGVGIVTPDQEWSMAHFRQLVAVVEAAFDESQRLIILVGGTGLYHHYATSTDPQLLIPPNEVLRESLATNSVTELQVELRRRSPEKWQAMNDSDRQNPRRLMRAIEIAEYQAQVVVQPPTEPSSALPPLEIAITLGLQSTLEQIKTGIEQRVQERLKLGAIEEVQTMVARYAQSHLPAFSATGVKDIIRHLAGELDLATLTELWTLHEFQYAKRQLTWWKKRTQIQWFEISQPNWQEQALNTVLAQFT